jgi:release factor glutamine methyltransferase
MSPETYLSSDDSAALRGVLRRYSGESCLEIGAGNGGGLEVLSGGFARTVGTDLLRPSALALTGGSVDFCLADAASCFRGESFDLVAFNPPYLPSDEIRDVTVDGGKDGEAVTIRFLEDAIRVLKPKGRIVFLLSGDNPLAPIDATCRAKGFSMKLLETRRLFYEALSVYELSRAADARP